MSKKKKNSAILFCFFLKKKRGAFACMRFIYMKIKQRTSHEWEQSKINLTRT